MVESFTDLESINVWLVFKNLPGASSMSPTFVSFLAPLESMPVPMPMMPTFATSPSSSALVACVVPWAMKTTSSGAIPSSSISWLMSATTPAATPSSWVVGIFFFAITSYVLLSMTTASVKVPPTSIPILTFLLIIVKLSSSSKARLHGTGIIIR